MGYMAHNAIIVTSWSRDLIKEAWIKATEIIEKNDNSMHEYFGYVSELTPSATNGYSSFFIAPDGSKEGWEQSDEGDRRRNEFVKWLDTKRYEDGSSSLEWVEVRYSSDDHASEIAGDGYERSRKN